MPQLATCHPEVAAGFGKESAHRALDDIRDSIAELAYYRDMMFFNRGALDE